MKNNKNAGPSGQKEHELNCITYIESGEKRSDSNLFFEKAKWLSADEAARYLRLPSAGSLRNLVSERRVAYHKLGRLLRFRISDLDDLLESSRIEKRI